MEQTIIHVAEYNNNKDSAFTKVNTTISAHPPTLVNNPIPVPTPSAETNRTDSAHPSNIVTNPIMVPNHPACD